MRCWPDGEIVVVSSSVRISFLLPDLRGGGTERVCVYLANELAGRGFAVDVLLAQKQGELLALLDPSVRVIDLRAARLRYVFRPLVNYLLTVKPAVLLANMWPLTIIAVLARMWSRAGARLVLAEHTNWLVAQMAWPWYVRLIMKLSMHWLFPRADAVLAVSQGSAQGLEIFAKLREGSIVVQYNPVVRRQAPPPPELLTSGLSWMEQGSYRRVLAVGSLKSQKNFPLLLRAFAEVCEKISARLLILGEGSGRAELEILVRDLGLQGRVDLPGFVEDPRGYYAHANLFVLSSNNEGLPTVVIEALEQGVPVVSTDCHSGPREILEDGKYGILVPVENRDALAQAMLESLTSVHDKAALKLRAQDFSVEIITDQYLDLLLPEWRRGRDE